MMSSLHAVKLFLVLALVSVVVVGPDTLFPFTGVKMFWFRAAVSFAFIVFLWWAGWRASLEDLRTRFKELIASPIVRAVTAFVFIFLLAVIFAYDPASAFWAGFERGEGGFQMLYYYLFFLLLALVMRDSSDWRKLFAALVLISLGTIGYGILAALGFNKEIFFGPVGFTGIAEERFWGSFGNAAVAGSFLLLSSWWAMWLGLRAEGKAHKYLFFILAGVMLVFTILTQTRGVFLGLVVSMGVFAVYVMALYPKWRKLFFVAVSILIILFTSLWYFRHTPLVRDMPILGRLSRISLHDRSLEARYLLWQTAIQGWQERPLLGWGPENFSVVFDAHFDTRHFIPGETSDTWYTRAHDVLLDYLVETGILGLASYLALFVTFYFQFFKKIYKKSFLSPLEQAWFFSFPVAYLVPGLVFFDTLPTYLHLFLFLAFVHYQFTPIPNLVWGFTKTNT